MSYVNILVHAVFGTKSRIPFLTQDIRPVVIDHIKQNSIEKSIFIDRINGVADHLHCLIALNTDMSIAKTIQQIKGESSYWINKQKLTKLKFEWADEYFAVSISKSIQDKGRNYIDFQVEHHEKMTFMEEYQNFLKENGFESHG